MRVYGLGSKYPKLRYLGRVEGAGFRVLGSNEYSTNYGVQGLGFWFWVLGLGFWVITIIVQVLGKYVILGYLDAWGSCRLWGLRVQGSGFRVSDLAVVLEI